MTKESGKMLGTLVALSIARMPNLVGSAQIPRFSRSFVNTIWSPGVLCVGHADGDPERYLDSSVLSR